MSGLATGVSSGPTLTPTPCVEVAFPVDKLKFQQQQQQQPWSPRECSTGEIPPWSPRECSTGEIPPPPKDSSSNSPPPSPSI